MGALRLTVLASTARGGWCWTLFSARVKSADKVTSGAGAGAGALPSHDKAGLPAQLALLKAAAVPSKRVLVRFCDYAVKTGAFLGVEIGDEI